MAELAKIVRVIKKLDPAAPHNVLLVLDATTGQNALNQVATFREICAVTGLVVTKLDGTARGGVLVAIADKFGLPVHFVGVGEQARSEEHTSELQSLMRISYAVFCLKKKKITHTHRILTHIKDNSHENNSTQRRRN